MNNALKYVKILEGTGITREQAEAHVQIISDILEGDLATKQDLKNLEIKLDTSIDRLDKKIDSVAERVEHKILQSEYRSTIKLGSIVTVVIAAATAVIKFL
jgi:Holliday junction resolvasome RuvABC endonuclease subunit